MIDPDDFEKIVCELNTEIAELTQLWETTRDENIKLLAALKVAEKEILRLRSIKVTVETPNDVCDGVVTDTIANMDRDYGDEWVNWLVDSEDVAEVCRLVGELYSKIARLEFKNNSDTFDPGEERD